MRHAAVIDLNHTHFSEDIKRLATELKEAHVTVITTGSIAVDQDLSLYEQCIHNVYTEEIEPYFDVKLVVSSEATNLKFWQSKKHSLITV